MEGRKECVESKISKSEPKLPNPTIFRNLERKLEGILGIPIIPNFSGMFRTYSNKKSSETFRPFIVIYSDYCNILNW